MTRWASASSLFTKSISRIGNLHVIEPAHLCNLARKLLQIDIKSAHRVFKHRAAPSSNAAFRSG
jgi:hypothetical protein